MFTVRRRLRGFVWLALAAMLAMALMPTVSHALGGSSGAGNWTEVCTPQGTQWVALDEAPAGDAAPAVGDHRQDCPYCRLSSVLPGLPPPVLSLWLMPAGGADVPTLFLHAPRTLFVWAFAQPRAPPPLS